MELSSEDSLRLNVLLANAVAVRIDEGALLVYGLSPSGEEAKIQLNPNARPDQYVRRVRELLSSHVLGSPGGYPVFLKRWTRMGQAGGARLGDLLMLGEPEAVVAVSGAAGLTDELAQRAWWAMPDAANARRMLARECVVQGKMGRVLADFLVEFLPFEEEARDIIESVRLVLQPGLIDEQARMDLWNRGRQKSVFRIGFLQTVPDHLPDQVEPHPDYHRYRGDLEALAEAGNECAQLMLRVLSGPGQTYIQTCEHALKKPNNQDAVCALLDTIGDYFSAARMSPLYYTDIDVLMRDAESDFEQAPQVDADRRRAAQALTARVPEFKEQAGALTLLGHVGEPLVRQIFAHTDAVGSVMRKKLEPILKPLSRQISLLRAAD